MARICKRCKAEITGLYCNSPKCKAAREKKNAAARRRRAGGGGYRRSRRYTVASAAFSWGPGGDGPMTVYPSACPKQPTIPAQETQTTNQ